jgi:hypothetical protein
MPQQQGKYHIATFEVPPGRFKRAQRLAPQLPQWEPHDPLTFKCPQDFQRTNMTFSSLTFVVPPTRTFTARDLPAPAAGGTQWEPCPLSQSLCPKDIGSARTLSARSSLEFSAAAYASQQLPPSQAGAPPSAHALLRSFVEQPRGLASSGISLPLPALPAPGSARAAVPEAEAGAPLPVTMCEVVMLRDGRGPPAGRLAPLPPALASAVAAARLLAASGEGMGAGERQARTLQAGALVPTQGHRGSVGQAMGRVQQARAAAQAGRLRAVDLSSMRAALLQAREGSLMGACGGTPAALRRALAGRLGGGGGGAAGALAAQE